LKFIKNEIYLQISLILGDNLENTLKLTNFCKKGRPNSLGIFLARPRDFTEFLKKTGYRHNVSVILPE